TCWRCCTSTWRTRGTRCASGGSRTASPSGTTGQPHTSCPPTCRQARIDRCNGSPSPATCPSAPTARGRTPSTHPTPARDDPTSRRYDIAGLGTPSHAELAAQAGELGAVALDVGELDVLVAADHVGELGELDRHRHVRCVDAWRQPSDEVCVLVDQR